MIIDYGIEKEKPKNTKKSEKDIFNKISPKKFSHYIGQANAKAIIKDAISTAKKLGEPLPHMLISSPGPGMGKTTLSNIIASESGRETVFITGSTLDDKGEIVSTITKLNNYYNPILVVDEAHNLKDKLAEMFYVPMEGKESSIPVKDGFGATGVRYMSVNPFSMICLTAGEQGKIPKPMLDRLSLKIILDRYSMDNMISIISNSAENLGLKMSKSVIQDIAKRSCYIPRIGNNLLMRIRDYYISRELKSVSQETCDKVFDRLGIDKLGMDKMSRDILRCLYNSPKGRLGIKSIASFTGIDVKTLENIYQPNLLLAGLMSLLPNGRAITEEGIKYCEKMGTK